MTKYPRIRVLELSGSHYDMGYQHGITYAEAIHHFAEERVKLSGDEAWSGRNLDRADVLALAEKCLDEHRSYSPKLVEELQGMADATKLSMAELLVVNGFTDFIDTVYATSIKSDGGETVKVPAHVGADNCTAFAVPDHKAEGGKGYYGQTWDMHDTATPHVILIHGNPNHAPEFFAFTSVGCVGMIGMNSEGIAVGINNLTGADGQIGVMWPLVVRKVLEQTNITDALECITKAKLSGAHNYMLFDKHGRGYNIEAMSTTNYVTELEDEALVHTNHCTVAQTKTVERKRDPVAQAGSEARLNQGQKLLSKSNITIEDLQALTRDPEAICVTAKPPRFVETCGAAIMRPATLDFWMCWGLPSKNEYEHFRLN
jgi:isopenicillin-N N-acyltransferase like protein